jgi:hypothetical protein
MAGTALYWQPYASHCHPNPAPFFRQVEMEEYRLDRTLFFSDSSEEIVG